MPDAKQRFSMLRMVAVLAIIGLFIADYVFDIMAKAPPMWAYLVPGLLALGIEGAAVARLIMQVVKAIAHVPNDPRE